MTPALAAALVLVGIPTVHDGDNLRFGRITTRLGLAIPDRRYGGGKAEVGSSILPNGTTFPYAGTGFEGQPHPTAHVHGRLVLANVAGTSGRNTCSGVLGAFMPTLSHLIAHRQALFIQCGMACRRVRLCPARLMQEYGDRPVETLRFRCKCGGKGKYKGSGYQGWPVREVELLSVPPWERALER